VQEFWQEKFDLEDFFVEMLPLPPAITPSQNTLEVESFLAQEKDLIATIKKLAVDSGEFKNYLRLGKY